MCRHFIWLLHQASRYRYRYDTDDQCCGSESERIQKFCLDPNPKKSSDSDPDTVLERKFVWKIEAKIKHLKDKNLMFFLLKNVFPEVQVPGHISKQSEAPFRKIWGQNISLRIRIRIRKKILWIRIRKKWVRIHNTDDPYQCRGSGSNIFLIPDPKYGPYPGP
jgi:hypothetical protein